MLSAGNFYIPIFEEALGAYNLPLELKYLPVIESAFNPSAVSRAGAAGLWQFMLETGKIYGLESNSLVDERLDPIKSTWAAARYLKELYTIYGDWNLVIAAYNCGPGNINKAIHRAGGESDYWKIYSYLPKETQGYVPAFIAANYVMNYYCNHNICPMETNIPAHTDTIQVSRRLHLKQVAEVCGVSMEQLRSLNPQYKHDILPGNAKPYTLRLPLEQVATFIDNEDSIYAYRADELFKNRATVAVSGGNSKAKGAGSGRARYHTVRKGETLGRIAQRYHVSVKNLQRWNGLKGSNIPVGKRLKISN
jgi:membrane-bound lytic murein transglycosylase D